MLIGRVLGPTEVEAGGVRVDLGGPLPRRMVAALLAAEGRPVSEDALAEALWAGDPPASPTVSLQAYVSRLRRALGGERDALERAGDGYRLRVDRTDSAHFADLVERGRTLLASERPGEALRVFDEALAMWRGEAFAGLPDFAAPSRARLAELRAVAAEERQAARIGSGDAPGAVGDLKEGVRVEPYRERRWELLILAQYRSGRQADALASLRRVRALLADELGIDPGPALQELESRLLAQDPRLLLPSSRPAAAVRPLTTFLGRTAELAVLNQLTSTNRLVTLVGPGGAGKTRLAVEHAAGKTRPTVGHSAGETRPAVEQTADRAWFVRLADATDPVLAVAAALGLRGSTVEAVTAALANRGGLLLLDNCEHLVEPVATLVLHLLAHCPGLRILATGREPLGVDGERLLPVAPLPASDAIALLTDRISAIRPGWRPNPAESVHLERIATALDGIPLALELAAARARVLSLAELSDLLGDRFPELGPVPRGALAPHQTLEAAVAWSVDLLSPADRALLLRLWPFEGGFSLTAVGPPEPPAGGRPGEGKPGGGKPGGRGRSDLTALSSLVARSVVVADTGVTPARYRLLEIIRAYCRAHDPDPDGSRAAHAAWVRAFVLRWIPELTGERSAHAIRMLNRELPNLRAGVEHDLTADPVAALRTAGLLGWFWFRGGHVTEGLRLLTQALNGAPDAPVADRARAWSSCVILRFIAGDLTGAAESVKETYAAAGTPADRDTRLVQVQTLYYDSLLHEATGDFVTAAARARESMAAARVYGEDWMVASGKVCLGFALAGLGEIAEGRRTLAEAIAESLAQNSRWMAGLGELALGRALLGGDPDPVAALAALRRGIELFQGENDLGDVLICLHTGAYALALSGRREAGTRLLAGVRAYAVRHGVDPDLASPILTAALERALPDADRAAGSRLTLPEMIDLLAPGGE
ncbi:BTAD domain-containing putative transcriptional regulator [Actinoplanes sp. NPDC051861]|uniref:BTAD domain-containing putative transcriptional regulator n=1 Tax=Actinoplanes sp. NPDC051861 TaxID=3155170 RepID=UPI00341EA38B